MALPGCKGYEQGFRRAGGELVIVNLQPTPKDKKASLVIHGRTDEVMRRVMEGLRMPIPKYMRQDAVLLVSSQERPSKKGHTWDFVVSSVHGRRCPLPLVQSVDVKFPVGVYGALSLGNA